MVDWKQLITGVLIGAILGIATTSFIFQERISRLEERITQSQNPNSQGTSPITVAATTSSLPTLTVASAIALANVTDTAVSSTNTPILSSNVATPLATIITSTPSSSILCVFPNGESISPESLARVIGGEAAYWTRRGPNCVWGYWNKDVNATFHHPGGNTILTYWSGFSEPRNSRGCWVAVPAKSADWDGNTRTVQCPEAGAEFEADGVGFHANPY